MKRILSTAAVFGAFLLSAVGAAHALSINPLLQVTDPQASGLGNSPYTLGWSFSTNAAVTVNALGVFDAGNDGLVDSHDVGLWNSAGALLASATVASGTVDPLVAQFRWAGITPVTLAAGQNYFVGALYLSSSDPVVGSTSGSWPLGPGSVTSPLITYIGATWGGASVAGGEGHNINTLAFPDNSFGTPGFFGADISTTPLPAALPLFGGGLVAIALLARRRRSRAAA